MKKLLTIALVMVLALSLAACGGNKKTSSVGNNTPSGNNSTPSRDNSTPSGNNITPSSNNGGNNGNATGYPKEWPGEIPKLVGKVNRTVPAQNPHDGCIVILGDNTIDEVKGYISSLIDKGFAKSEEDEGDAVREGNYEFHGIYNIHLSNGTYKVSLTFTESLNQTMLSFEKK